MLLIYGEHGQPLERVLNPKYAAAAGDDADPLGGARAAAT